MNCSLNKIIVNFMKDIGIKYCFGIPGSNLELLNEIRKEKSIKLILTKHENNAVFMATGVSKSTGMPAACFGSQGPGALNMIEGIAAAYHDSQPILIIVGQIPEKLEGKSAFQEASGKGNTVNQFEVLKKVTKFCAKITDKNKNTIKEILKKIYQIIVNEKKGPVCLQISTDVMKDCIIDIDTLKFNSNKNLIKKPINIKNLSFLSEVLLKKIKVAILCGSGATHKKSPEIVKKIVEKLNIPLITTLKGRGIIPENHPLCFGCVGLCGNKKANKLITSDLEWIVVIGSSLSQFTTLDYALNSKKIIRVDIDEKYKNKKNNKIFICGDADLILKKIENNIKKGIDQKIIKERKKWLKQFNIKFEEISAYKEGKLRPQFFISQLRKYLPKNAIICTESIPWTTQHFQIFKLRTHITSAGLAPIGCSLPEAIGAKLANPKRIVVSIQGDGGFNMCGMELLTAKNYNIPIISVIFNNKVLGPIFNAQIKKYGKSFFSSFENPNFKRLAESFGIKYFRIKTKKDIKEKIPKIIRLNKKGYIVLVDVITNPFEKWP